MKLWRWASQEAVEVMWNVGFGNAHFRVPHAPSKLVAKETVTYQDQ